MGEVQEGKGVEEEDGDGGRRLECHRRVENEDAENNSQHMDEQIENAIGREEGSHDVDAETEGRGDGDEELINVGVGEDAEDDAAEEQDASGKNNERTDETGGERRGETTIRSSDGCGIRSRRGRRDPVERTGGACLRR